MRRRKSTSQAEAPGQDSFLDVVANLVGILIILVMVVGAHAKSSFVAEGTRNAASSAPEPDLDVDGARTLAAAVQGGVQELEGKIARQDFENAYRRTEREQLQSMVLLAQQKLAEHRDQLSEEEKRQFDLKQQLIASQGELELLQKSTPKLEKPPPTVLQHLPTPMARTVFGQEVHFRLMSGRLAYVPMDEMQERLKADAQQQVEKLRRSPRVEGSLPAVAGFGAMYQLRLVETVENTRNGQARYGQIGVDLFFVDAEENLGEPFSEALRPGSSFRTRIGALDPKRYTITVWVYPDNFDQYRELKAELYKAGFLCAARPKIFGEPIGASTDGTRSSAE